MAAAVVGATGAETVASFLTGLEILLVGFSATRAVTVTSIRIRVCLKVNLSTKRARLGWASSRTSAVVPAATVRTSGMATSVASERFESKRTTAFLSLDGFSSVSFPTSGSAAAVQISEGSLVKLKERLFLGKCFNLCCCRGRRAWCTLHAQRCSSAVASPCWATSFHFESTPFAVGANLPWLPIPESEES